MGDFDATFKYENLPSSRLCCRLFRSYRKESETPGGPGALRRAGNRLADEEVGGEAWMPTASAVVPAAMAAAVSVAYFAAGAR